MKKVEGCYANALETETQNGDVFLLICANNTVLNFLIDVKYNSISSSIFIKTRTRGKFILNLRYH